jgi:hypothetical protein
VTCDICGNPLPDRSGPGRKRKRHAGECEAEAKRRNVLFRYHNDQEYRERQWLREKLKRLGRECESVKHGTA